MNDTLPQGLWLWVSKPTYTQDEDGYDRDELEPDFRSPDRDWWWTCDGATRDGDLALLYRTSPYSEVHWLVKAHGSPYSIAHYPEARRERWSWGTMYEVLASFDNTITFSEMANSQLSRWDAVIRKLHGGADHPGAWPVPMVYWRAMATRLISRNPGAHAVFAAHMRPTPSWLQ